MSAQKPHLATRHPQRAQETTAQPQPPMPHLLQLKPLFFGLVQDHSLSLAHSFAVQHSYDVLKERPVRAHSMQVARRPGMLAVHLQIEDGQKEEMRLQAYERGDNQCGRSGRPCNKGHARSVKVRCALLCSCAGCVLCCSTMQFT